MTSTADRIRSRFGLKGKLVGVQVIGTMIPSEGCMRKALGHEQG